MKTFDESDETLRELAEATSFDLGYVAGVMRDVHYVIDSFIADDFNVLLGPLYFIRSGNPVVPAMVDRFTPKDWHASEGLKTAAPEELATALQLSVEEVEEHPCAFGSHVLNAVADWRGVPEQDTDEFNRLDRLVWAWRDHMGRYGINYRVSTAGLESTFEDWLIKNLDVLANIGIHVELVACQPYLAGGRRRADMVCRVMEPIGELVRGDLLVIENKATPVGIEAFRQVDEYADLVKAEMANGRMVGAMLIADGTTVELQHELAKTGVIYESLVSLGYREHLYLTGGLSTHLDVVRGTDASVLEPVEADLPDSNPS